MTGLELTAQALGDLASALLSAPFARLFTWTLALMFAWSGSAKVRHPASAAMALVRFGLIVHAVPRVGAAVGALEIGLAVTLIVGLFDGTIAVIGRAAACGLLLVFLALISRELRRGNTEPCFCFGGDEAITGSTVLRNFVLATLAGLLLFGERNSGQGGLSAILLSGAAGASLLGVAAAIHLFSGLKRSVRTADIGI